MDGRQKGGTFLPARKVPRQALRYRLVVLFTMRRPAASNIYSVHGNQLAMVSDDPEFQQGAAEEAAAGDLFPSTSIPPQGSVHQRLWKKTM